MTPNADSLLEVFAHRRSMGLSRLKADPVEPEIIQQMMEAANWAPSHKDTEPWRYTVFTGEGREKLADLFEAAHRADDKPEPENARKRAFASPVWISIGMQPALDEDGNMKMTEEEELMAVAMSVQNLHLMACASGLAGMWHSKGISIHPTVAAGLGLQAPARLLGFFMCGWPNCDWPEGERRPLSEKVKWISDL